LHPVTRGLRHGATTLHGNDLVELFLTLAVGSVVQGAVHILHLRRELVHDHRILLGGNLLLHIALEALHDSLGLAHVASPGHLSTFHDTVLRHQGGIRVVTELLALTTNLHLLGDDSEALGAIESRVLNLGLEGEV